MIPKPIKKERHKPKRIRRTAIKRTKRPRRLRKSSLAALRRKLWSLFAAYVKARDGNACFSCGRLGLEGANWHAGHMFPANGPQLIRWAPKNVHSQCARCNLWLSGNTAAYVERFINVYGIAEFRRLSRLSRTMKQWKAYEIEDLIEALRQGGAAYELLFEQQYAMPNETVVDIVLV